MPVDAGLLTIPQIVSRLPGSRGARRVHPATVTRWILSGSPALDGSRAKLAATRAGSRWLVWEADLEAFFAALAGPAGPAPISAPPPPAARRASADRAARELERLGA